MTKWLYASPQDPTLDAEALDSDAAAASNFSSEDCAACRVALVEGSQPGLSRETQSLLQSRLRAAAILLAAGFAIFFVIDTFVADWTDRHTLTLYVFHFGVVLILSAVAVGLCRKCPKSMPFLRVAELLCFGLPAAYFLVQQALVLSNWAPEGKSRFLSSPTAAWVTLIFLYALYVPNTWRRAATVLGTLAAIPVLLFLTCWLLVPQVSESIFGSQLIGMTIAVTLAAVAGVWGVYSIGRLRREAFEARQFGQYRLTRLLGAGGMGEVYLAEHQLLKRPCAIKLIRPGKASDPQALARFEREVRATAKLSHWNTVEIFDYGSTDDGTFYYVMEYLPGLSLAELVERHGPLPAARAIHLLEQTCEALSEAHGLGLIHRDIKPGNIFAAQRGGIHDVAKLLDFGLAKPILAPQASHLTIEGTITGSPQFMAPEQASGDREPDARSDIYSLGAVAYYLLTGRPPFDDKNTLKILMAHVHTAVVPPSQLRPEIPRDLETVVLRCLAKDPEERFPDTASLANALADCDAADSWTREHARRWWAEIGTPAENLANGVPANRISNNGAESAAMAAV
jgi:serine/threonine-protein kinase